MIFMKKKDLKWSKIILNSILFYFFLLLLLSLYIFYISKDLPSLDELQRFNPQQVSKIISSDGKLICLTKISYARLQILTFLYFQDMIFHGL